MRRLALILYLCLAARAATARVTFVTPLDGAQAVGPQWLEVTVTTPGVDRVEFSVDGALAGVARKAPWRIAHDFGTSPASHEVVAKVLANGFRTVESARVITAAMSASETYNVDVVELPLRIRASRAVRASDLRVTEDGVEQTVREVRADRGAARFVFIIDRSLSMDDGRLTAALAAIDAESALLRPGDRMEAVLFNHNVSKPRTIARGERLTRIFSDLAPSGGTSLRDALASAASRERTYAIVITDGGDRNSIATEDDALRRISGTKTVVDAIILGDRSTFLARAADATGGALVHANAGTLREALHQLLVDINSRYTLAYQSSSHTSGWRKVRVTSGARGVDVVNGRKEYFAQ